MGRKVRQEVTDKSSSLFTCLERQRINYTSRFIFFVKGCYVTIASFKGRAKQTRVRNHLKKDIKKIDFARETIRAFRQIGRTGQPRRTTTIKPNVSAAK